MILLLNEIITQVMDQIILLSTLKEELYFSMAWSTEFFRTNTIPTSIDYWYRKILNALQILEYRLVHQQQVKGSKDVRIKLIQLTLQNIAGIKVTDTDELVLIRQLINVINHQAQE